MSQDNLMLHWSSPEGRTSEATQHEECATEDCRGGEPTERCGEVILNTKKIVKFEIEMPCCWLKRFRNLAPVVKIFTQLSKYVFC